MPTLPAAGYSTPQAPSVGPAPEAGTPYQSASAATPDAFGYQTGAGLNRLAAGADEASQHMVNLQNFFNEIAANQATNDVDDKLNKVVYGDPDTPGDVGFIGKHGDAAMRAAPDVHKQIDQIITQQRAVLQNPAQQLKFDIESRRLRTYTMSRVGQHYDSEFYNYQVQEAKARGALNATRVSGAAADGDQGAFDTFVAKSLDDAKTRATQLGLPPEAAELDQAGIRQHAIKEWANGLAARGDAVGADAFIDRNKAMAGDQYDNLKREFHAKAKDQQVYNAVFGGPVMVRGGATQSAIDNPLEKFLDLTAQHESGGRNIMQQAVPAGGGYNPSTGTVTGPSTAQGYYQITNSTWKSFAPGAGVDVSKYPNAMSAPPDLQRAVAREIATRGGVQNWTNYNPGLKAAAAAAGLPVTGTLASSAPAAPTDATLPYAPDAAPVPTSSAGGGTVSSPPPGQSALPAPPPPVDPNTRPDSAVPGLQAKLAEIDRRAQAEHWPPDVYRGAYALARERLNAAYTDEQRNLRSMEVANKKTVQDAENDVIADHYSDQPKLTATQVSVDHRFDSDPQARMRMLTLLKPDKSAVDPVVSANTKHDLMKQITDGGVTDRAPVVDAYNAGRLTDSDFNFLNKQVEDVRTPGGLRISKARDNLIAAVKTSITKSNPLEGSLDPSGDLQLGAFTNDIELEIEQMRKDGKSPAEIAEHLNPKRFIQDPSLLAPYQVSMQESTKNIAQRMSRGKPPPAGTPPADAAPATPSFLSRINPFGSAAPAPAAGPTTTQPNPFGAPAPVAPPVVPRKPDESPADYMKRVGGAGIR